jgi:hypothetical protein
MANLNDLVREAEVKAAPKSAAPPPAFMEEIDDDGPLYAARRYLYPQSVRGFFRNIKWSALVITLGIYYLLPFVRWDRGPLAPSQAVLIDFPARRFYFFFIELWPQEIYYLTGLLILAAIGLFLMNALAGRVWCGYLCPQTVWTDLFYAIELDTRDLRPQGAQAFPLDHGGVVDRRRLGSVFRRRADPGEGSGDRAGALRRLSVDWHSHGVDLYARRLDARAGLPLYVPVAAYPGGADRRIRAQRHLSL